MKLLFGKVASPDVAVNDDFPKLVSANVRVLRATRREKTYSLSLENYGEKLFFSVITLTVFIMFES